MITVETSLTGRNDPAKKKENMTTNDEPTASPATTGAPRFATVGNCIAEY
ncbi:MAG: hypothetical protein ACREBU_07175 [Nitrososphaera sp.]